MLPTEDIIALISVSGLVGILLNPVITFLKTIFALEEGEKTKLKRFFKTALAAITSIGGGLLVVAIAGKPVEASLDSLIITGSIIFTSATLVYNTYWKDSTPEKAVVKATKKL